MISLPAVFASHALYQQNAALHFRGTAAPSSRVEAILRRGETVFCRGGTTADDMGGFQLPLPTPPASFEPWELIISDGEDTVTLEDLLFGELWMAAGQSNMEMGNNQMPGAEEVFETLQTCHIRFFQQMSLWDRVGGPFPFEPQDDFPGCWHRVQEWEAFGWLSACATAMARAVYRVLNRTAQVPLGIIDSNMGATYVEDWLPKDSFFKDPVLREWMETAGQLPSSERWDTYGDINYLQPSAMFNTKTYPLHGIQVRGILWYQGEGNTRGREHSVCYRRAMEEYHRVYASCSSLRGWRIFPSSVRNCFPGGMWEAVSAVSAISIRCSAIWRLHIPGSLPPHRSTISVRPGPTPRQTIRFTPSTNTRSVSGWRRSHLRVPMESPGCAPQPRFLVVRGRGGG